jgi:hypothetical protein
MDLVDFVRARIIGVTIYTLTYLQHIVSFLLVNLMTSVLFVSSENPEDTSQIYQYCNKIKQHQ